MAVRYTCVKINRLEAHVWGIYLLIMVLFTPQSCRCFCSGLWASKTCNVFQVRPIEPRNIFHRSIGSVCLLLWLLPALSFTEPRGSTSFFISWNNLPLFKNCTQNIPRNKIPFKEFLQILVMFTWAIVRRRPAKPATYFTEHARPFLIWSSSVFRATSLYRRVNEAHRFMVH